MAGHADGVRRAGSERVLRERCTVSTLSGCGLSGTWRIGHDPRMNSAPWILAVLSSCLVGCTSTRSGSRSQAVPTAPVAPTPVAQDPFESIARLEDLRSDGDGLLQALAARGEERTRVRAVRALGRLPLDEHGASVSDALVHALEDASPRVRSAAAFALGLRADPTTVGALVAAADDLDSALETRRDTAQAGALLAAEEDAANEARGRAVEALSRIDDPRARRAVIEALDARIPFVAQLAALGIHRFPKDAPEAAAAETELVNVLGVRDSGSGARDEEFRWRALSTLARRATVGARAEFERGATASDPRTRIFALQGLGALPPDPRAAEILRASLADPDWRVACEAAYALGKHADAASIPDLVVAAERTAPALAAHHVRRAAVTALGRMRNEPTGQPGPEKDLVEVASARNEHLMRIENIARPLLQRALRDESPAVRAAALESLAQLLREGASSEIEVAARSEDAVVRAGAAAAIAHLSPDIALAFAPPLLRDPDLKVRTTAADALLVHAVDPLVRAQLRQLLAADDNGVRLSAATALKDVANEGDLPSLERALASTRGEISAEVAAAIVDAAAHVGGDGGLALLRFAIAHPDPYVARKARAASLAIRADPRLPRVGMPVRRTGPLPPAHDGPRPRVAIDTTRGTLVFELLPDEAPFHVENLLQLARRGHYDGTPFHRVVPDFVVQGGDRRGDGNGGTTWRGDPLRGEFGPRPFRRGSLGMPRNDDPDSGGSQIFVTHRETPHLDGRYTLFGELVEGFDVLDALEVGDRIQRVRELPVDG